MTVYTISYQLMRKGPAVALMICVLLCTTACRKKSEQELMAEAEKMKQENNLLGAKLVYEEFLEEYPASALRTRALFGISEVHAASKDFVAAREYLDQIIENAGGPNSHEGLNAVVLQIQTLTWEKKHQEALDLVQRTSESLTGIQPTLREMFMIDVAPDILSLAERKDEAVELIKSELRKKPVDPVHHRNGFIRLEAMLPGEENIPEIISIYENYLERHPDSDLEVSSVLQLARLNSDAGNTEEAEKYFARTIAILDEMYEVSLGANKQMELLSTKARVEVMRENFDEAEALFRKLIEDYPMSPGRPVMMIQLADVLARKSEYDAAGEVLQEVADSYQNSQHQRVAIVQLEQLERLRSEAESTTRTMLVGPQNAELQTSDTTSTATEATTAEPASNTP